jgi:predicted dehydrogenase
VGLVSVSHAALDSRDTLELYGTEGSARTQALNEGTLRVVTRAGEREERLPPHANLHQPLVEDFIAALREGRDPTVTGEIGREVSRVLAAIYQD